MKSNEDKTLIIVKAKVLMEQNCIFWLLHSHQSSVFRESFVWGFPLADKRYGNWTFINQIALIWQEEGLMMIGDGGDAGDAEDSDVGDVDDVGIWCRGVLIRELLVVQIQSG